MHPALLQQRSIAARPVSRFPDNPSFITQFQSGHGWTGHAVFNLNSTDNPLFGTQCVKYGPLDPGGNKYITSPGGANLDLTDKVFLLYIKVDDDNSIGGMIQLGDDTLANRFLFPIPNGHLVADAGVMCWKAALSTASVEAGTPSLGDIDKIRLTIYNPSGVHTAHIYGIAYESAGARYPNGAVTFCYDDSEESLGTLVYPLHQSRNVPGNAYVIGQNSEPGGGGVSITTLRQMQADGWDICGHAERRADHVDMRNLTDAQVDDALRRMKRWLVRNGFKGYHFAYPYGRSNAAIRTATAKYFSTGRAVAGGLPSLAMVPAPTSHLYRIPCPSFDTASVTVAQMKLAIDEAYTHKLWAPLLFHNVNTAASSGASISITDLAEILDYAIAKDMAIVTMSEMFGLTRK